MSTTTTETITVVIVYRGIDKKPHGINVSIPEAISIITLGFKTTTTLKGEKHNVNPKH
jgi:hypothetical protein